MSARLSGLIYMLEPNSDLYLIYQSCAFPELAASLAVLLPGHGLF